MLSRNLRLVPPLLALLAVAGIITAWGDMGKRPDIAVRGGRGPNHDGVLVKVSPWAKADQRAALAETWMFQRWRMLAPILLGPWTLANPLWSDVLQVEIVNSSDKDLNVIEHSARIENAFWVRVRLENAAGKPVVFPHAGQSGIKRLGPAMTLGGRLSPLNRAATLKPGQRVVCGVRIWSGLNIDDVPPPGKYMARVVCSYDRASDGRNVQIESAPVVVNLTKADVRGWRNLYNFLNYGIIPFID